VHCLYCSLISEVVECGPHSKEVQEPHKRLAQRGLHRAMDRTRLPHLRTGEKLMRLFQHDETGRMCWSGPTLNPECFTEVPTMYEDELPEPMGDEDYAQWFANSKVVDGVRVGPRVTARTGADQ
jgi:hypothetical protein